MDWNLTTIEKVGTAVVCLAAVIWILLKALEYIPVMGGKLDQAQKERIDDLKGVIAASTAQSAASVEQSKALVQSIDAKGRRDAEQHEGQTKLLRELSDGQREIIQQVKALTCWNGVERRRAGDGD